MVFTVMRFMLLAVAILPGLAHAWSGDGHAQIADIAWVKLTPKAQEAIGKILAAGEPKFRPLGGDVRAAFRDSATFPDYIKNLNNVTAYEDVITAMNVRFMPNIASIGNEGVRCKTWHYYDIPIRYKSTPEAVLPSNANVALNLSIDELGKMAKAGLTDPKMACWWLYWIEHIVGDLHQPLHCVSSHEHDPKGDDGGNKFMVKSPEQDREQRLHGMWDGGIGRAIGFEREQGMDPNVQKVSERWLADAVLKPLDVSVNNLDVMDWIKDGAQLADKHVYGELKPGDKPNSIYIDNLIALSKKQAVLAGERMANILNKILG